MGKRISGTLLLALSVLVLGALIVACQQNEAAPTLDGEALARERCTVCHTWDRIESAQKSADGWQTTVARMVSKGANLNEAEQLAVIGHLSEVYPE